MSTGSSLSEIERRLRGTLERQVAALRQGPVCDRFVALHDAGDPIDAVRHAAGCTLCQGGGRVPTTPASVLLAPGTAAERRIEIADRLFVGRECAEVEESRRLVLLDRKISRDHLEIRLDPEHGHAWVLDTSSNGTVLDGETIERGARVALHGGARLLLGDQELRFEAPGFGPADARSEDLRRMLELAGVVGLVGAARRIADGTDPEPADLSAREREVLVMMARGDSDEAIAERLALAPGDAEAHTRSVFRKLGISGTVEDNGRVRDVLGHIAAAERRRAQGDAPAR